MIVGQLAITGSRGWYSIGVAGTRAAVFMSTPMNKPEAIEVARWLNSLTDWSRPLRELASDSTLAKQITAKRAEILARYYEKP